MSLDLCINHALEYNLHFAQFLMHTFQFSEITPVSHHGSHFSFHGRATICIKHKCHCFGPQFTMQVTEAHHDGRPITSPVSKPSGTGHWASTSSPRRGSAAWAVPPSCLAEILPCDILHKRTGWPRTLEMQQRNKKWSRREWNSNGITEEITGLLRANWT